MGGQARGQKWLGRRSTSAGSNDGMAEGGCGEREIIVKTGYISARWLGTTLNRPTSDAAWRRRWERGKPLAGDRKGS
jgi:hypothetical protein